MINKHSIKTALLMSAMAISMWSCTGKATDDAKFQSTIVNEDGTVTFRYANPDASAVQVDVQFAGRHDMVLDSLTGVWSVTLGPAAPDMYPYCFIVDGVSIMDPENMQYFPNEGFKNSLLEIPNPDGALLHDITDVPHGSVDYITYPSQTIGTYNHALVYTPPSYQTDSARTYPVFYLISGTTDTEEVYYKVGRANYILDNLIAQGKAKDMIIVMPYGNPAKLIDEPSTLGPGGFKDYFSEDLINDLMPYVEANYRTINDADHRGIGGFSRGGNQGLMNGLMNLDKFSYLCSYSSFTATQLPGVYDNADDTNSKIHLLWSGVGTDDFLYGNARDYTEFLDNKGIRCVKYYTDDKFGHTWMNAKDFLGQTFPLLFDAEASEAAMVAAEPTKAKTGKEQEFTPGVMARLFPKPVISPEIKADSVTFRIKAESTKTVNLVGDFSTTPYTMACDSDGIWAVTIAKPAPDVYCYYFDIDGKVKAADNQNMYLAPEKGFKRSILETGALVSRTPVQYRTEKGADGTQHKYAVVSPKHEGDVPVVALIATGNDTYEGWHKVAQAGAVLDTMLASGAANPCILVLSDTDVPDATVTLRSGDYANWSEARKALAEALKSLH